MQDDIFILKTDFCSEMIRLYSHTIAKIVTATAQEPISLNTEWHFYMTTPDSKVHGANMGPIWGRQDPGGPLVGPMNFSTSEPFSTSIHSSLLNVQCATTREAFSDGNQSHWIILVESKLFNVELNKIADFSIGILDIQMYATIIYQYSVLKYLKFSI